MKCCPVCSAEWWPSDEYDDVLFFSAVPWVGNGYGGGQGWSCRTHQLLILPSPGSDNATNDKAVTLCLRWIREGGRRQWSVVSGQWSAVSGRGQWSIVGGRL